MTYAISTGTVDFTRKEEYTYLAGSSSSYTTGLVSTYKSTVGSTARTFTYTYDANGNITQAVDSFGYIACRYVYDDLGQLIREDNTYLNCTVLYTYDNAGNLLTQKKYALTAAGTTPSGTYTSKTYTYGNSVWGDQLTKFGGTSITYDANGNPLVYYNGYTFTWKNGNELATATKGSTSLSFSYDDNGVRVRKTVGGVDHIYTVNGTQILSEAWDGNLLLYLYDASGAPIGMAYHGSSYPAGAYNLFFFETNLQGDVIAVYDEVGTKLLTYTYDAWGNCTQTVVSSTVNGTSDYAATYNPFRYRGYYYDTETALYYLNSRYYDPNTGRFISADRYVSTGQGFVGFNMYAYCINSPINRVDNNGAFSYDIFGEDLDEGMGSDDDTSRGGFVAGGYYGPGSAYYTYYVRTNTAAYDAMRGGYYTGSGFRSYPSGSIVYPAQSVGDDMAVETVKPVVRHYVVPKGGGGVSHTIQIGGKTVTFGHGGRRIDGDIGNLESKIAEAVAKHVPNARYDHVYVYYDGVTYQCNIYYLTENEIKVGTYYPQ